MVVGRPGEFTASPKRLEETSWKFVGASKGVILHRGPVHGAPHLRPSSGAPDHTKSGVTDCEWTELQHYELRHAPVPSSMYLGALDKRPYIGRSLTPGRSLRMKSCCDIGNAIMKAHCHTVDDARCHRTVGSLQAAYAQAHRNSDESNKETGLAKKPR